MDRAVQELPQVATLVQAGFVNAESARQELVAAQRTCGPGNLSLEHDAAQGLVCGRFSEELPMFVRCAIPISQALLAMAVPPAVGADAGALLGLREPGF